MAIKFDNFKKVTKTENLFVFADLCLDLNENTSLPNGRRDIKLDYDYNAIRNELLNLFTTNPGENLLLPDYGITIKRIIGEPITPGNANIIGVRMQESIKKYAPRINLLGVYIFPDPDNNEYLIKIRVSIPKINNSETTFSGSINQTKFTIT